jgi:hypothetical protein
MGLAIGFATTFLAILGLLFSQLNQARAAGKDSGIMQEKVANLVRVVERTDSENKLTLKELNKENQEGHAKIYDCLKETDVNVGKFGTHLSSLNAVVERHTQQIEALEKDSHERGA